MCLSLFQIKKNVSILVKRWIFSKGHPFSFMFLAQPSFFVFECWCDQNSTSFQKGSHCAVWCLSGGGRLTFIYHRSFMLCCKLQLVPVLGRALDRAQSLKLGSICLAQFTLPQNAPQSFLIEKNALIVKKYNDLSKCHSASKI